MTNTEFSPVKPLFVLLREHYPDWPDAELQRFLEQWKGEFDAFECQNFFADVVRDADDSMDQLRVKKMVETARHRMLSKENYNGTLVRYVIGQVIEREVGLEQKRKYWKAVLIGKVL